MAQLDLPEQMAISLLRRNVAPSVMANWRKKRVRIAVRMNDGRFLVIAEEAPDGGDVTPVALFDRDPTDPHAQVKRLGYRPAAWI